MRPILINLGDRRVWGDRAGIKAGLHFQAVRKFARSGEEKPARHGCHANAALHNCHDLPINGACGGSIRGRIMGFFTEMFARPRPQEHLRYRAALALLHSMSGADRADIGVKPADFPRIAREMSAKCLCADV
jgi:hypothetical protein